MNHSFYIRNFRVDKTFIGTNGISIEEGITTPNIVEAQTKKAMINCARKVIVVADSSKFSNISFAVICPVKAVTSIITSEDIDKTIIKSFEEIGVDIITK